jgi:hypothetical protein
MKPCPYCAAQIEETDIHCRNCERWLDPKLDSTLNADSPPILLPPRTKSGLAIGSLACGLLWVCGIGSIAALILGYLARRQIRRDPFRIGGKGMATAGIVLGWLGILGMATVIVLGIYFWKGSAEVPNKPHSQQVRFTLPEMPMIPG